MRTTKGAISNFIEEYYLHFNAATVVDAAASPAATERILTPRQWQGTTHRYALTHGQKKCEHRDSKQVLL